MKVWVVTDEQGDTVGNIYISVSKVFLSEESANRFVKDNSRYFGIYNVYGPFEVQA